MDARDLARLLLSLLLLGAAVLVSFGVLERLQTAAQRNLP